MKCLVVKFQGVLHPSGDEAIRSFEKMKTGKDYIADVKMPRNIENHKRYFSLVNTMFDMQEKYDDPQIFRKVLQIEAGHFDLVDKLDGRGSYLIPKSIAFEKMPEDEFKDLYNRLIDIGVGKFGVDRDTILRITDYA